MNYQHKTLAEGRWYELSLADQMGNIGSEISRALRWREQDKTRYQSAIDRGLELFDLTLSDPRWRVIPGRLKEIARAREFFCDAALGTEMYNTSLEVLDRYFMTFALMSRRFKV